MKYNALYTAKSGVSNPTRKTNKIWVFTYWFGSKYLQQNAGTMNNAKQNEAKISMNNLFVMYILYISHHPNSSDGYDVMDMTFPPSTAHNHRSNFNRFLSSYSSNKPVIPLHSSHI